MLLAFHRFYREICFALVVLFGLSCGLLTANILEYVLLESEMKAPDHFSPPKVSARTEVRPDVALVIRNNIFDPASRGREQISQAESARSQGQEPPLASGDLTLIGTLVSGSESWTLLAHKKEIRLYRVGDEIIDGSQVEAIARNSVTIRHRNQSLSELTLKEARDNPQGAQSIIRQRSSLVQVDANRWKVPRGIAEKARKNIAEQLRLAMLEPRVKDGRTDGFLIKQLNPRSLLAEMGMQRGDVVLQVNDMRLDSPEKALQIMQQLREARSLSVDIERQRNPVTFYYEIE